VRQPSDYPARAGLDLFELVRDGKQRELDDYILSKDTKRQGGQLLYMIVSQKFKEKGGVSRCEIAQERIDGERASVTFQCHYG
jgi:hypothetical protein